MSIFDHLQQPALVLDREGRVVIWNDSIAQYTGVAAEEILGKGGYAHAKALFGERRPTLADCVLTHSNPGSDYYRLLAHDGEELLAESRIPLVSGRRVACMAAPLYDPAGRLIGAVETIRDAPGERSVNESAGVPEDEVQVLAKSLPDMIFTLNRDGVFLRFLWTGGQEMGLDTAEITGRTPRTLFPEEEADFLSRAARQVIETGEAVSESRSFLWHDEQRSFQITIHPLHDAAGEIVAATGVARDITRELLCERTLQETSRFSSLYLDLL
ncbi:PAS domain-containing protein, partial [Methanoculleus bourgensis]